MVEQIDNPANRSMHYGKTNIGILNPPNSFPKVQLYSYNEGIKAYNEMQQDLYIKEKQAKPPEFHKFPTVLKIIIGGISIASAVICRKNIAKYFKNLVHRHL